jgi:Fe2+ transport system protein FeoA
MFRPLNSIRSGETVTVAAVDSTSPLLLSKFVSMGIVAGSKLTVTQRGLFGSPINVKLFGSVLSLRENEAAMIRVTEVSSDAPLAQGA